MFKTPKFWYPKNEGNRSLIPCLLRPISALYQSISHQQIDRTEKTRTDVPVICVGNIVAGGAGKTPVTIALADLCRDIGFKPHILTRGYGGKTIFPAGHILDEQASYPTIGDEALLMGRTHAVCVADKRDIGAEKIVAETEADIILMDDGLQNRDLFQDIKMLVIDGASGLGNGMSIPSGPLRETLEHALKRIDAVIMIGDDAFKISDQISKLKPNCPIFVAVAEIDENGWQKDQKYIGFCGLGRPEKFKKTLAELPINLTGFYPFADHHPYGLDDLNKLQTLSKEKSAKLITTEKDMQRIPKSYQDKIDVVPMRITWQNEPALRAFISKEIADN